MAADAGPIGGDMSHEFVILADTGESQVFCHKDLVDMDPPGEDVDYNSDLTALIEKRTELYAATDGKHDQATFEAEVPADRRLSARGIEVGHIFYFGTKYSKSMGASVAGPDGEPINVEMGSYGIGVSRLVAAIIEAYHDDDGIIWPDQVAPFAAGILNLKVGDRDCDAVCEDLYAKLAAAGRGARYDDRDERAGAKFATMDLIGLPWRITVGPKGLKNGVVELVSRRTGESEELPPEQAVEKIARIYAYL